MFNLNNLLYAGQTVHPDSKVLLLVGEESRKVHEYLLSNDPTGKEYAYSGTSSEYTYPPVAENNKETIYVTNTCTHDIPYVIHRNIAESITTHASRWVISCSESHVEMYERNIDDVEIWSCITAPVKKDPYRQGVIVKSNKGVYLFMAVEDGSIDITGTLIRYCGNGGYLTTSSLGVDWLDGSFYSWEDIRKGNMTYRLVIFTKMHYLKHSDDNPLSDINPTDVWTWYQKYGNHEHTHDIRSVHKAHKEFLKKGRVHKLMADIKLYLGNN